MSDERRKVENWLVSLGQDQNHVFSLDESDCCYLEGENGIQLTIQAPPTSSRFFINADLGDLPAENREELYHQALVSNLFQYDTRGAVIAIDPIANKFLLSYNRKLENTDFQDFHNIINNLLDTALSLKEHLNTYHEPGQTQSGLPAHNMIKA